MIHFTHTGYYVGAVMCGAPKDPDAKPFRLGTVDIPPYIHPCYGLFASDDRIKDLEDRGVVCPDCARVWLDAGSGS